MQKFSQKDYLISGFKRPVGGSTIVEEWGRTGEPETLWYPKRFNLEKKEKSKGYSELTVFENFNPKDARIFEADFPEGARVDDGPTGLIHIWGNGKPEKTFAKVEDFIKFVEALPK